MAEAYPSELRNRVVRAYEAGEGGYAAVGIRFAVSAPTVLRWVRRFRANGDTEPTPKGGGTPSSISSEEVAQLLEGLGDPTANELTAEFNRSRRGKARVHVSSMKRALHRHGYVVKKNAAGRWKVFAPKS
jgi:transposase